MIFIERNETNPYFNIAAEEYALRNFKDDILMLWESKDSVVLGKHQNAFAEVNYPYLIKNRIPLIRRISGGGTVFHSRANLNITVIRTSDEQSGLIDFREFTRPLMEFLAGFGIETKFEGKNNLTVEGLKFSGNSAHIFKNRVLHHGTILFDANLDFIEEIVNENNGGFKDKAIKSVRAEVTNLKPYFNKDIGFSEFKEQLKKHLLKEYNINEVRTFTKLDKNEILRLMQERYKSWDWNFGYSPAFEFNNEIAVEAEVFRCKLKLKNAKILDAEIHVNTSRLSEIEKALKQKKFSQVAIRTALFETGLPAEEINKYLKLFNLVE